MSVQRIAAGDGERHQAAPGTPIAEALIGARGDWPVALVHVTVPAGGAMPDHDHGSSHTIVAPLSGSVRIVSAADGGETALEPGCAAAIPVGERVRLENTGEGEARLLVVLDPPDFAEQISGWPLAEPLVAPVA